MLTCPNCGTWLLEDALHIYEQLGARPHAERAAASLEAIEREEKGAR